MLKNILFIALAASTTFAQAQDALHYRLKIDSETLELNTLVGSSSTVQNLGTDFVVAEINSNQQGGVENVISKVQSGVQAEITAAGIAASGRVDTVVRFTKWEKGMAVTKGTHSRMIAPGESVTLPAAGGKKVTLTLLASATK